MTSKPIPEDIRRKFQEEVITHVRESEELLKVLGNNGRDPEALERLGRHLHAVKGSAPIMGAHPISTIARELEECVDAVKTSPDGAQGPLLEQFSAALRVISRQIVQFEKRQEMESGNEALEALRSLMPAAGILEAVLKHLALHAPELSDTIDETHRQKLKEALTGQRKVYTIHLSLPRSSFQAKLVESLKVIRAAGTALAYAVSSKSPRQGFDQSMYLLVVSEHILQEFSRRLEPLPADIEEVTASGMHPAVRPDPAGAAPPATELREHPGRAPAQKRRVLVVEDSDATRELYRMILLANGFEVETARDGREALERLKAVEFHAVLSDDQMPVMDGMELLRVMKSDEDLRKLPVILMSGKGTEEDREKALAGGAVKYFVKGMFEKSALIAAIKEAVR